MTTASADSTAVATSPWGRLLDRLEERLRRIEIVGLARPGTVDAAFIGPEPTSADVPTEAPTDDERLRLLALMAAHDQFGTRLHAKRDQLRRAERYQLNR